MSERIDYTHYASKYACATGNDGSTWSKADLKVLLDEINRIYAREDELLDALRIIKADLDEGIAQGHIAIEATTGIDLTKIRNFANDASK